MNYEIRLLVDPEGPEIPANWQMVNLYSEADFVTLVAQISEAEPALPTPVADTWDVMLPNGFITPSRPIHRPLMITTDQGTHYLIPIDGGRPRKLETPVKVERWSPTAYPALLETPLFCAEKDCWLRTPNQGIYAWQADANTIFINYHPFESNQWPATSLRGQAFAFSASGQVMVVWNDGFLILYLLTTRPTLRTARFEPYFQPITTIPFDNGQEITGSLMLATVRWSADGTTVMYADTHGIWVLDIYHQRSPQLVIPADDDRLLQPLFFSTTGRFLAYTSSAHAKQWVTVDRLTAQTYENAVFSPDEQFMVRIAPTSSGPISSARRCDLPITLDCGITLSEFPPSFAWTQNNILQVMDCDSQSQCILKAYHGDYRSLAYLWWSTPWMAGALSHFTYDSTSGNRAALIEPQTVVVNLLSYDLHEYVDGEIVDVAWLPSLFYREN